MSEPTKILATAACGCHFVGLPDAKTIDGPGRFDYRWKLPWYWWLCGRKHSWTLQDRRAMAVVADNIGLIADMAEEALRENPGLRKGSAKVFAECVVRFARAQQQSARIILLGEK